MYDISVKKLGADDSTAVNYNDGVSTFLIPTECVLSTSKRPVPVVDDTPLIGSAVIMPPESDIKSGRGHLAGYMVCTDEWDKIRRVTDLRTNLYGACTLMRGILRLDCFFSAANPDEGDTTSKTEFAFKWGADFVAKSPMWYLEVPVEGITTHAVGENPTAYRALGIAHCSDPIPPAQIVFNNVNQFVISNLGGAPLLPNIAVRGVQGSVVYLEDALGVRFPVSINTQGTGYYYGVMNDHSFYTRAGSNTIKVYDSLLGGSLTSVAKVDISGSYYRWY